jgi:hypothetical protein
MIKFSIKLAVFLAIFLSSVVHAGLITTDLTKDNYVTIGNLDWAWASSVNVKYDAALDNTLYDPDFHDGWRYATIPELALFKFDSALSLSYFAYTDAVTGEQAYKHALNYWNSNIEKLTLTRQFFIPTDIEDFIEGRVQSEILNTATSYNDQTFYVRTAQVPEPSTIMIFAIALIALSMRKRAIK